MWNLQISTKLKYFYKPPYMTLESYKKFPNQSNKKTQTKHTQNKHNNKSNEQTSKTKNTQAKRNQDNSLFVINFCQILVRLAQS